MVWILAITVVTLLIRIHVLEVKEFDLRQNRDFYKNQNKRLFKTISGKRNEIRNLQKQLKEMEGNFVTPSEKVIYGKD